MWRHFPWLLGLILAPLLYGCVTAEGQVLVGFLLAASLILLSPEIGRQAQPTTGKFWKWLTVGLLLLPLIPLPFEVVNFISPERARLAREFPLEIGTVPQWITLSTSPGGSIQRLWEIGLILACFILARSGASLPAFPLHLARTIACAVALLALSDVWFRAHDRQTILGIWPNVHNYVAGTFANRNHFANWMMVAIMFLTGWLLRQHQPLHAARTTLLHGRTSSRWPSVLIGLVLSVGLTLALATGSRGGFMALMAGGITWAIILAKRSRSRKRWMGLGVSFLVVLVLIIGASGLLFDRVMGAQNTFSFKISIWQEALRIFWRFPWFGTGWGSFVTIFSHYKTSDGEKVFWHAENELVQLLMEGGIVTFVVVVFLLYRLVSRGWQFAWQSRMPEPELCFGALAGIAAFLVHSQLEFVFQIPANAMLVATLLGVVIGMRDEQNSPEVAPPVDNQGMALNLCLGMSLMFIAVMQGTALRYWLQAQNNPTPAAFAQSAKSALLFWPWESQRSIGLARAEVRMLADTHRAQGVTAAQTIRQQLNRALEYDPFNWELRLERVWLDLAFSTNHKRSQQQAWEVMRLNPLQSRIPLRFANHYQVRDPALALKFLHAMDLHQPENLKTAMALAWRINPQPTTLWDLTPDTPACLAVLGDFAMGKGLNSLAAKVFENLAEQMSPTDLARKLLAVQQPEAALAHLPPVPSDNDTRWLIARIHLELGHHAKTIQYAEPLWNTGSHRLELITPFEADNKLEAGVQVDTNDIAKLTTEYQAARNSLKAAKKLAEKIFTLPAQQRTPSLFHEMAAQFPATLRFQWMALQTELDLGQQKEAAQTALQLGARAAGLDVR
jgi:O-antigen ligase